MSSRRRGRNRMQINAEINVVSLIDVMMLLMIIFMITAAMMQGGIDVALPQGESRPLDARSGLVVSVTQSGAIYVGDIELTYGQFVESFSVFAEGKMDQGVYLRADESVDYGTVARVLAHMRASGVGDIGMVLEPEAIR